MTMQWVVEYVCKIWLKLGLSNIRKFIFLIVIISFYNTNGFTIILRQRSCNIILMWRIYYIQNQSNIFFCAVFIQLMLSVYTVMNSRYLLVNLMSIQHWAVVNVLYFTFRCDAMRCSFSTAIPTFVFYHAINKLIIN